MSKNLTRKGLALVSGTALALTSLVGVAAPASAAAGDVTMKPTTGTSFTVFNTDSMKLTTSVNSFLSGVDETLVSYRISNPDQHTLLVDFNLTADESGETIDVTGYKADGSTVSILANGDLGGSSMTGDFVIDFANLEIVAAVINDIGNGSAGPLAEEAYTPTISVLFDETAGNLSGLKTTSAADALARLGYGEGNAIITVEAWLESSSSTVVDAAYASAVQTVTFVDPASVSVISKVERVAGATPVVAQASALTVAVIVNDHFAISAATTGIGSSLDNRVLEEDDRILLTGQSTVTDDGIYIVQANDVNGDPVIASASAVTADLATYTSGIVTASLGDGAGDYPIAGTAGTDLVLGGSTNLSATYNLKNDASEVGVGGSLRFSNGSINLDQVDLTNWEYALTSSVSAQNVATAAVDLLATTEGFNIATANVQELVPAGYLATNKSAFGRLLFRGAVTGNSLSASATYKFTFRHGADLTPFADYSSAAVEVVAFTSTAVEIDATVAGLCKHLDCCLLGWNVSSDRSQRNTCSDLRFKR